MVMKEKAIETGWINLHKMFHPIASNTKFLWASEQDGYRHLYVGDLSIEGEGAGAAQEPSSMVRLGSEMSRVKWKFDTVLKTYRSIEMLKIEMCHGLKFPIFFIRNFAETSLRF